ncbi:glycine zipper 2TM domain-containing protein [Rhizorhapis sp.]|uniref:glycine zipper 2TM domain-containing protein n=1 Tax=Rhizorhapis sp. TaxID=1968842 RepID=UPI002B490513|nr:glycine zipper 2TM domain-containing protein [Rhizorhapis sp.]HKR17270.1 glycine zipper 2TM domain-containing protein [Rhizorhapis sp.]
MLMRKIILATALAASAAAGLPSMAQAHDRGWHHGHDDDRRHWRKHRRHHHDHYYSEPRRYSYDRPERCKRSSGTTGLILGGAAGALLGREVDRYGDRTPGTVIGAGAGALIGRELDRGDRC